MNSSLVWQLVFESLRWQPDHDRLAHLAAQQPDINRFQSLCSTHGLLPIVDKALGPVRQTLFTAEEAEEWRRVVASRVLGSLVMHREQERILHFFATANIQAVPFKGPTLSERLYGDPVLRVYSDLDLLMSPGQVYDAVNLLMAEGYQPDFDLAALAHEFRPASREIHCVMRHPSRNLLVELHWALTNSWHRRKASPIYIDDWLREDSAANEELLLYLCLHASLHLWRQMKWVVDVDRCVNTAQGLDWLHLFATAKSRGCSRALNLGLILAVNTCGLELPAIAEDELRRDRLADSITKQVAGLWMRTNDYGSSYFRGPSYHWRVGYYLACRDNWFDRVKMVADYGLMRLGDRRGAKPGTRDEVRSTWRS